MTTMIRKIETKHNKILSGIRRNFYLSRTCEKKKKGQIGKKISFILRLDSVYTIVPNLFTNMMPLPRAILHNALTHSLSSIEIKYFN